MNVLYVIGAPGVGKSTLVEHVLSDHGVDAAEQYDQPVPHLRYCRVDGDGRQRDLGLWEIGRRREAFSGTDALAMNINPRAIQWVTSLADHGPRWLIGEGDRLANRPFLTACPNLTVVALDAPADVIRARGDTRAAVLGRAPQPESWWKGRSTKVRNLVATLSATPGVRVVTLNAEQPVEVLAAQVYATMN